MDTSDRKRLLKIIEKIWDKNPQLRLGQLLCNLGNFTLLYYISDEELEMLLQTSYGVVDVSEKKEESKKEVKETKTKQSASKATKKATKKVENK